MELGVDGQLGEWSGTFLIFKGGFMKYPDWIIPYQSQISKKDEEGKP